MKKEQTIIKFDNIKDLLYHSANTYADNIAFTTKIKNGKEWKKLRSERKNC